MKTLEITVGALLVNQVRDYVGKANACGGHLKIWESSGWLEKNIVISGPDAEINLIRRDFINWFENIEMAKREQKTKDAERERIRNNKWYRKIFT